MYGIYSYPFHLEKEGITIDISEKNGIFFYTRECCGKKFESFLSDPDGKIHINPVEPVNLPKSITKLLEIEFDRILIPPESSYMYYITFPVEICVFLESGNDMEVLDLFSKTPEKYSLYGSPTSGEIVRYHKSHLYRDIPKTDFLKEGVMSLTIKNPESDIASVSSAVFDSYGMKLYYNEEQISMVAQMKILPKKTAETEFINVPLIVGMEKSTELYFARKISVIKRYYLMEWGFD